MTRLKISDLEIERPAEPLEIELSDGAVFELQDPKAVSVDTMVNIESMTPIEQVKALIAHGKWDEFAKHPDADGYLFDAVMKKYNAHFGILGDPGEGAASSPSASGTARLSKRTSPKKGTRS